MLKLFLVILSLLSIKSNCFAMTLSQPVELGMVASLPPNGEFKITGATSIQGSSSKGIASFDRDNLFIHYDNSYVYTEDFQLNAFHSKELSTSCRIGGKNLDNTLILPLGFPHSFSIHLIPTDENIKLYLLAYDIDAIPYYTLIGKKSDGIFVKYFETVAAEQYYGMMRAFCYDYQVDKDKFIFKYGRYDSVAKEFITRYELHFKWIESSHWFGVEQFDMEE